MEESGLELDEWALGALRGGGISDESIQYIDLTGDGLEEAIVLLDSGGTAGYLAVWVYGYVDGELQSLMGENMY
ncbi:MAG: hypothetical protein GTN78_15755, partial [Gemmatimonadales bacterium]|nr:hypothetical protein [Gemmatimonadales bacterium]